jgi:hypothetical protein
MDVYARSALPPVIAIFAIAGSIIALVAGVVVGLARARRRDALAAAAAAGIGDTPPSLVEGAEVVLAGVVRHYEDHEVAVKVSITQFGSESESSGSWSHSWTEIDREIVLAPFLLELADGALVLVDPPKDVDVADALDQKVWINRNRRVLSAELVPGERIYARGRLERTDHAVATSAYRDVQWGWGLRAASGQMLLSSEPLGDGLRKRAAFHRRCAWAAMAVLAVTQLTLLAFYERVGGRTEARPVISTGSYQTTDSDGDTYDHYVVRVDGTTFEVSSSDYARLREGTTIPIRIGSRQNRDLGASATITWLHAAFLAVGASGFWIGYWRRRRRSRPWFRRKLKESGAGRLPDAG